jgi:hypothetical protein
MWIMIQFIYIYIYIRHITDLKSVLYAEQFPRAQFLSNYLFASENVGNTARFVQTRALKSSSGHTPANAHVYSSNGSSLVNVTSANRPQDTLLRMPMSTPSMAHL